jgi:hypothetical protein
MSLGVQSKKKMVIVFSSVWTLDLLFQNLFSNQLHYVLFLVQSQLLFFLFFLWGREPLGWASRPNRTWRPCPTAPPPNSILGLRRPYRSPSTSALPVFLLIETAAVKLLLLLEHRSPPAAISQSTPTVRFCCLSFLLWFFPIARYLLACRRQIEFAVVIAWAVVT